MKTEDLHADVKGILSDGKFHSVSELCLSGKYPTIEIKEYLLELLKARLVQCKGTRWKQLKEFPDTKENRQLENSESEEYFIHCWSCKNILAIQTEFIGMKAECPFCNATFFISSEKKGPNEYKTFLQAQMQYE